MQSAVPVGVELRSGAERIAGVVRVNGLLGDRLMPVFPDKRRRLVVPTGASQATRNLPKSGVDLSVRDFDSRGM